MTDPQLTYTITTAPHPLGITPKGRSPESSRITIMVSRAGTPVKCGGLKVTFKQGAAESDLTTHLAAITPSVSGDEQWRIDAEGGSFVARPEQKTPLDIGTKVLLVEFSDVQVNGALGVTTVEISEWIDKTTADGDPTASTTAKITKYLPGFRFADFYVVNENGKVGQPIGIGKKATLHWTASQGADYSLLYDNKVENVTGKREFEITPTRDTTYYLRAEVTAGGQKTEHFLSTTVQVMMPKLDATSIEVTNFIATGDKFKVDSDGALDAAGGKFHIANDGHFWTANNKFHVFADGKIHSAGPIRVVSPDNVGYAGPAAEEIKFQVDGDGKATATGIATKNLDVTTNGTLTLSGSSSLFSTGVQTIANLDSGRIENGTKRNYFGSLSIPGAEVKTDGFLFGTVRQPSPSESNAVVNAWIEYQGSYFGTYSRGVSKGWGPTCSSFMVPIASGQGVTLGISAWSGDWINWWVLFYWIPLGTYREIGGSYSFTEKSSPPKMGWE
jgi:hypothetical protein